MMEIVFVRRVVRVFSDVQIKKVKNPNKTKLKRIENQNFQRILPNNA